MFEFSCMQLLWSVTVNFNHNFNYPKFVEINSKVISSAFFPRPTLPTTFSETVPPTKMAAMPIYGKTDTKPKGQ